MTYYTVLYRDKDAQIFSLPSAFVCQADEYDHAEEQCENAYPGCRIVWVVETDNVEEAFDDWNGWAQA